jgi:hypothetical protein
MGPEKEDNNIEARGSIMNTLKLLKIITVVFAVIIVALLVVLIFVKPAGGPASPAQKNGEHAVSPDGHVTVDSPLLDTLASSPLSISGSVTGGGWFFEATFPVEIMDGDGTVLDRGQARAQSDWTSTATVPFAGVLSFSSPHSATGTIVFSKDNPSGLPQNGESFSVPVRFGR